MTAPAIAVSRGVDAAPRRQRFPALDGVRALAVVLVFVYHGVLEAAPIRRHVFAYTIHLDVGVELFFVLSGFLIYRPFVAAHVGARAAPRLGAYAKRRILRIYPAYIVAISVLWAIDLHLRDMPHFYLHDWGSYFESLTLTQSYWPTRTFVDGMAQSWTLVVEVTFYAVAPLWSLLVVQAGRRLGALRAELAAASFATVLGFVSIWLYRYGHLTRYFEPLFPGLATLGAGMLLATLTVAAGADAALRERFQRLTRYPVLWWGAAVVVFVILARSSFVYYVFVPFERWRQDTLQAVIAILIVTPCVLGEQGRGPARRLLSWRPVVFMGTISYAFYLWHLAVIDLFGQQAFSSHGSIGGALMLGLAFAVSAAIATVSWYVLERPILSLAHRRLRWPRRGEPGPVEPPPATAEPAARAPGR